MGKFIDLTGQRFERLVVTERAPNYEKYSNTHKRVLKYAMWKCLCDCGNTCIMLATDLKSESQVSCGCFQKKAAAERLTSHGMRWSREYAAWRSAKSRCFNSNNSHYSDYGGRGITMQKEWVNDFMSFYNHIGNCPSETHSLDRIDTNGNYEEGNVRWADVYQQMQNQRKPKRGSNKFKLVHYQNRIGKFRAIFTYNKVTHCLGYFEDENTAAIEIYKLYKAVTGHYPKYIDESLKLLGLI